MCKRALRDVIAFQGKPLRLIDDCIDANLSSLPGIRSYITRLRNKQLSGRTNENTILLNLS